MGTERRLDEKSPGYFFLAMSATVVTDDGTAAGTPFGFIFLGFLASWLLRI
jgi:hypothetical protein